MKSPEMGGQTPEREEKGGDKIKKAIEMLKAEAENTNTPWKEGDPVYVASAGTDQGYAFVEQAGISCWENTDIASKRFESVEDALKEIEERAENDRAKGAEVKIDSDGMSYTAEFPQEEENK